MTENFILRGDLPPDLPDRMKKLPLSSRGYPVPWFVQWIESEGSTTPTPIGQGYPEFRMMRPEAWKAAVQQKRCWVCGGSLGAYLSFVIGPMCAINRTTAEPPCHRSCADWSARACPFLAKPKMVRREAGLPTEGKGEMPGVGITRNPGVAMVWTTRSYKVFPDGKGKYLINMGEPTNVDFFARGREATREEVLESIDSGLPILEESLKDEPPDMIERGRAELKRLRDKVVTELVPA